MVLRAVRNSGRRGTRQLKIVQTLLLPWMKFKILLHKGSQCFRDNERGFDDKKHKAVMNSI